MQVILHTHMRICIMYTRHAPTHIHTHIYIYIYMYEIETHTQSHTHTYIYIYAYWTCHVVVSLEETTMSRLASNNLSLCRTIGMLIYIYIHIIYIYIYMHA